MDHNLSDFGTVTFSGHQKPLRKSGRLQAIESKLILESLPHTIQQTPGGERGLFYIPPPHHDGNGPLGSEGFCLVT